MLKTNRPSLNNQKGMAVIEAVPLLVIFVMLMSFGMGLFGVIHTATLHSIAARAYAFETFRQRTNLVYFRENGSGLDPTKVLHFKTKGFRFHAISHESDDRDQFVATTRPIRLGRNVAGEAGSGTTHNRKVQNLDARNQKVDVNPVWVMVGYGICLDSNCGR